jgi:5'-3' exonuclease
MPNFIMIDGSYFIFFRYYALVQWWKVARKEPQENFQDCPEFIEKFKKTFSEKVKEISKKLQIENAIHIVGKDCPRETIWRNELFVSYKMHRVSDPHVRKFFKLAYDGMLFSSAGCTIFTYPTLEADDCIAISTRRIQEIYPEAMIYIITSDMDYLQLASDTIKIYNLKYTELVKSPSSTGDAKKDLFCKIVMGDKSDGIQSIFPKCGIKTAIKCFEDPDYFEKKLNDVDGAREKYELNKKLIDFNYIPQELVDEFRKTILHAAQ